jgi:hypothetical protein
MKASTCEPRWKWRRISQFASGRTKVFMPKTMVRCSHFDEVKPRGSTIFSSWISTIDSRASGRTTGSTNWRERDAASDSHARLTSSASGPLASR